MIWYLLHCQKQNEWKVLEGLRSKLSKTALKTAFVFTYDRMRRFEGEWHLERRLMFPDYVFLETGDERALTKELMHEEMSLLHVKENEKMFLTSLCGEAHHLGMSKGIIQNGATCITEGPLRGMEERISRIDRHKRLARLATPGRMASGSILAGLEIIEKS
ncbi:hypothetical protein GN277_12710 [Lachnospiraceae bacterium WCA-9-b2]|uniref:NusG-like N-terminal domain-containing protein n=1 Tax=Sporofaciens musculi TaxID=2681861 RepID=A0A7X3MH26_9FIRM|nr:transcription termination/antitermination NusG family protein [Sporofaciens musculi]MXP76222.1 hypothetical protein [Sporofaciens musculi]